MQARNNNLTLTLDIVERALLDQFAGDLANAGAVFILGAPRTGSTVLYQAMANAFGLPFISNFTNTHFAATPIIGLAIQNGIPIQVGFDSSFGKTSGPFQPSEGSAVMMNWFGGGHPSQIVSTGFIEGRQEHCLRTLSATEALCGAPLLVKNAWHCFRVPALATALPSARFVWIRRDIRDAAASDLEARYRTKNNPNEWNSATPANVEELLKKPPHEQVVENQMEFNAAIAGALAEYACKRSLEVWYEDLVADPAKVLGHIGVLIGQSPTLSDNPPRMTEGGRRTLDPNENSALRAYVETSPDRFAAHIHPPRS